MNRDTLTLSGLRVFAYHGVLEEEKSSRVRLVMMSFCTWTCRIRLRPTLE